MAENAFLLSLIVFLPALGALLIAWLPNNRDDLIKGVSLVVTLVVLALVLVWLWPTYDANSGSMQRAFSYAWIPSFNINYAMGLDGFSFPLVVLTAVISALSMGASWNITKHVKAYCVLFLTLECAMLGVFMALDFFLFYIFWEVMLLPMYFLIGVWGGPRRLYASVKFFIYTLVGGVLMLIALLILYFQSDLREVAKNSDFYPTTSGEVSWAELNVNPQVEKRLGKSEVKESEFSDVVLAFYRHPDADNSESLEVSIKLADDAAANSATYNEAENTVEVTVSGQHNTAGEIIETVNSDETVSKVVLASLSRDTKAENIFEAEGALTWTLEPVSDRMVHSFNLLALAAMGQKTAVFSKGVQIAAFVLLFIGFIIKLPSVPFHTWLPDAHVEAPTPISMILAGVLLKMGGYGIIRICYPICPWGGYELAFVVCLIGVISMVYGAFAALAQKDFKRMVAYSSVSHMGYVLLGMGVWSIGAKFGTYNPDYWNMGVSGAMFQMIGHGISSAGMFFMVGVIYDRVHHRNLNEFGGLFGRMPVYTALSIGIFFAGLGLPGLCGFIGEVFVVLSVWKYSQALAIVSAAVVVLTAAYILWAIQRVYLGAEYKGPHPEALKRITPREFAIALPLFVLAIVLGVAPYQTVFNFMDESVTKQVEGLSDWTKDVADKGDKSEQQTVDQDQQDDQRATEAAGLTRTEPGLEVPLDPDTLVALPAGEVTNTSRGPPDGN